MKQLYVLLAMICGDVVSLVAAEQETTVVQEKIAGLNRKIAEQIFQDLQVLVDTFYAGYTPGNPAVLHNESLVYAKLQKLKEKTEPFTQLSQVVLQMEEAIKDKNGIAFGEQEGKLRELLRPTLRSEPIQNRENEKSWVAAIKSYFFGEQKKISRLDVSLKPVEEQKKESSVFGDMLNRMYQWLFPSAQ